MTTRRLGKGLEALIPTNPLEENDKKNSSLEGIKISIIHANPYQPRHDFDLKKLEELKKSIKQNGVIQPITVRKKNNGYEVIAGERRLRAVRELEFDKIPAYIMSDVNTEDKMLELALIENIQRQDLNAIELAKAYKQLQHDYGLTQEKVAEVVGKDRATVANFIRLLKLPEEIQNSLKRDEISMGHARTIVSLSADAEKIFYWKKIVKGNWNVRRLEEAVKKKKDSTKSKLLKKKVQNSQSVDLRDIEEKLRSLFGTKIKLKKMENGGQIIISYYSNDDLDRILEIFYSVKNQEGS